MRRAAPSDAPVIHAFLQRHIETSMFLLGNLETQGTEERQHPHGTRFFLREEEDVLTGVFGATVGGFVMCQMPGLTAAEAEAMADRLLGYTLRGLTGPADQAKLLIAALHVPEHLVVVDRDEPLFVLDLAKLSPTDAQIRGPKKSDFALLAQWFAAYGDETGTALPEEAMQRAEQALSSPTLCLMTEDDAPVAMANINASAGDTVQVGGVYVPPELRNAGRAGRIVQAMLGQLHDRGCARAILFAASEPAARAYARIGFDPIGAYRVFALRQPHRIGEPL